MRADPLREGARWLEQAEEDLRTAEVLAAAGRHYMVCFVCQQAAEKALKGLLDALGEELVPATRSRSWPGGRQACAPSWRR